MVDDELEKLDGSGGSGSGSYPIRGAAQRVYKRQEYHGEILEC